MQLLIALFILAPGLLCSAAEPDIYVVVNKENPIDRLEHQQIIDLYMGKTAYFSNQERAVIIDISPLQDTKAEFYNRLIGKSLQEVNAYWARLLFTGRATPPLQSNDEQEAAAIVRNNKNAIGYIRADHLDSSVKVVYVLN